jgi:hypothetical protein
MKNILSIILISITLVSCKPEVIQGAFTVKGGVFKDCSKTPIINMPLELKVYYYENNYPKYKTLSSATTDSTGKYSFSFTNPPSGEIYLAYAGSPYPGYINSIPFQNIDSLFFYTNASAKIKSKLVVTNSYSNTDTLFVYAFNGFYKNYKLVGPFSSGQLFPDFSFRNLNVLDYGVNTQKVGISYKIGTNSKWIDSNINVFPCSQNTINIEIK